MGYRLSALEKNRPIQFHFIWNSQIQQLLLPDFDDIGYTDQVQHAESKNNKVMGLGLLSKAVSAAFLVTTSKISSFHYNRKKANINSQKRQSPLTLVVIGHRHTKTANIIEGGEGKKILNYLELTLIE